MKGLFTLLLLLGITTHLLATEKQEQPVKNRFEAFILLSAGSAELRLFMPELVTAAPQHYMALENSLTTYSKKWTLKQQHMPDRRLLQQLFYDVHRTYLKNYTTYTGMLALLEKGEYNCISATALYALLLDRLGYTYEIVESSHHVALVITLGEEKLLFETTDPFSGFIDTNAGVQAHLAKMKAEEAAVNFHRFHLKVFRTISLRELAGLQYFNSAAWFYNQQQLTQAATAIRYGQMLYQTQRFDLLKELLTSN